MTLSHLSRRTQAQTSGVDRTVCRRAEKRLVAMATMGPLAPQALSHANRLFDPPFVLHRLANERAGIRDIERQKE